MKFPETVREHEAIPLQPTVYGWAKVLGHNGYTDFHNKRIRRNRNTFKNYMRQFK